MTVRSLAVAAAAMLASACSQPAAPEGGSADGEPSALSEREARAILTEYLAENPACTPFFALPRDVPADATHEQKRMDAFAAAGLIRREPSGQGVRYATTAEGAKFIGPGNGVLTGDRSVICYGRYEVDRVAVGSVDPVIGTANVTYRYVLKDAAAWLETPAIVAFYPDFGAWRAARQAEDQHETLRWHNGRWVVDQPSGPDMYDLRRLGR